VGPAACRRQQAPFPPVTAPRHTSG
jgi:hypothetical protein